MILYRVVGSNVLHKAGCGTLINRRTTPGVVQWLWAMGKDPKEVKASAKRQHAIPCAVCKPFKET